MIMKFLIGIGWILIGANSILLILYIPVTIMLFNMIIKELHQSKFKSKRQFKSICLKSFLWPLVFYWRMFSYIFGKFFNYGSKVNNYIGSTTTIYKNLGVVSDDDDLSGSLQTVDNKEVGGGLSLVK